MKKEIVCCDSCFEEIRSDQDIITAKIDIQVNFPEDKNATNGRIQMKDDLQKEFHLKCFFQYLQEEFQEKLKIDMSMYPQRNKEFKSKEKLPEY